MRNIAKYQPHTKHMLTKGYASQFQTLKFKLKAKVNMFSDWHIIEKLTIKNKTRLGVGSIETS